jgi:hypothetical protein
LRNTNRLIENSFELKISVSLFSFIKKFPVKTFFLAAEAGQASFANLSKTAHR